MTSPPLPSVPNPNPGNLPDAPPSQRPNPPSGGLGLFADGEFAAVAKEVREQLMPYKFGLEEVLTKINILREELGYRDEASPIEHVSSRLKSAESVLAKARRLGLAPTPATIGEHLHDIAGIRIVCSFIIDAYRVAEMLLSQPDLIVVHTKDYIADPKPSGYRSLHLIVDVPVFLSEGMRMVRVEIQIRTVAMDSWASMEHRIYYKFDREIPGHLRQELAEAARASNELDLRMQQIHQLVHASASPDGTR